METRGTALDFLVVRLLQLGIHTIPIIKNNFFWVNATSYEYATQITPMFSIGRI